MATLLLVVVGVIFIGVQYWCLATRLRYRTIALVSVFIISTFLGFVIGYVIIPHNPAMILITGLTSGMSNTFGVQMMVARLPKTED